MVFSFSADALGKGKTQRAMRSKKPHSPTQARKKAHKAEGISNRFFSGFLLTENSNVKYPSPACIQALDIYFLSRLQPAFADKQKSGVKTYSYL